MNRQMLRALIAALIVVCFATGASADDEVPKHLRERIEQDRPHNVSIARLTMHAQRLTVEGSSLNPNAIGNFVSNVKADPLFEQPTVKFLRRKPDTDPSIYEFEFSCEVRSQGSGKRR